MQPSYREDSSQNDNEQPQPARVQPEPIQPAPPAEPRRKKGRSTLILVLLLLLALGAAASMGWLWYQQNGRVDNLEADLSTARNNVAQLESAAKAEKKLDSQSPVTDETTKSDSDTESIISAVTAYAHAQSATSSVAVTIKKLQPPFAAASYTDSSVMVSGGGLCILKEADDIWMVLYCAQADSEYTQMLDKTFAVPSSIKAN